VTVSLSAGQSVVIVVDGYGMQSGAFMLNVGVASAATFTSTPAASPTVTRTPSVTPTPRRTATATASPTPTATPAGVVLTLAASQDAWIDAVVMRDRGSDKKLHVRSSAAVRRILLQFDLSAIPAASCVSAALLDLTLTNVATAARAYELRPVGAAWTEAEVTWDNRQTAVPWTAPGGDFGATTAIAPTGTTNGAVVSWDVTDDVAAFVSRAVANNGWLIKDASEGSGGIEFQFAARNNQTLASRPRLEVAFGPCP
jgi:disaggregatase-related protein